MLKPPLQLTQAIFVRINPKWEEVLQNERLMGSTNVIDLRSRDLNDMPPPHCNIIGVLSNEQADLFDATNQLHDFNPNQIKIFANKEARDYEPNQWYETDRALFIKRLDKVTKSKSLFSDTYDIDEYHFMEIDLAHNEIKFRTFTWHTPDAKLGFFKVRKADIEDINKIKSIIQGI